MHSTTQQARDESKPDALERLLEETAADMDGVNTLILERADSHVEMVPELARYLIEAGGKRLRPMLTIAAARLFTAERGNEVRFAAAVEFMHNATLLHDDVVDESQMRRGKPAARVVWGNQASVLVGDFLLGQAFLMMVEAGDLGALGILSQAAAVIAEGEVFQLSRASNLETTAEDYHEVIRAKTATLFEAALHVGARAGGALEDDQAALARYGLELGRVFQLVDDVLDYGGAAGALGKNTGDDLREGKMTLPVILALQAASEDERKVITDALGREAAGADDVANVVAIMTKYETLKTTLSVAEECTEAAKHALRMLPESPMRDLLAEIADFCLHRGY